MKTLYASLCFFMLMISGCGDKYPPATTALNGAREFIDACLKGDFEKAKAYMIDDGANQNELLKLKRDYNEKSNAQKQEYMSSSIIINEDETVDDSTHIINYKNSYDKTGRKVKVLNRNGEWLVDFKYTFSGNL